jgi:queuosine precursor transporter
MTITDPNHRRRTLDRHAVPVAGLVLAYVAALATANLLTSRFGLVPAGSEFTVTAGTYAAGLALALRDTLQDAAGPRAVLVALAAGAALSILTADPRIVLASTTAALAGELIDLAVYTRLRPRSWTAAVAASGVAGAFVDTAGFLLLAGLPLTAASVTGQLLVKAVWVTGTYLTLHRVLTWGWRAVSGQRQHTGHS